MSVQTTTSTNHQNNSLHQSNGFASNTMNVGNIGGGTTQTSNPNSNGQFKATVVPVPALMQLVTIPYGAQFQPGFYDGTLIA